MSTEVKRYTGVIRQQFSGKSFVWCPEIEELVRFYTIDVDGAEIGSTVEFEVPGLNSEGPYYAENVSVVDTLTPFEAWALATGAPVEDTPDNGDPITADDREALRLLDDARTFYAQAAFAGRAELTAYAANKGHDADAFESAYVQAGGEVEGDELEGVIVGTSAEEIPCETCGKLFWSLDDDHTECRDCDEAAGKARDDFMVSVFSAMVRMGTQEIDISETVNEAPIDPRDAEIERLKAENTQLKQDIWGLDMAHDVLMRAISDLERQIAAYESPDDPARGIYF